MIILIVYMKIKTFYELGKKVFYIRSNPLLKKKSILASIVFRVAD